MSLGRWSAIGHAGAGHELARRQRPGGNRTWSALLLTERHRSARACVAGRELPLRGHPGRERPSRPRAARHRTGWKLTGRKLTRRLARVAGRHADRDSRPVKPRRTGTAGTARQRSLTRAGKADAILAAVERPWTWLTRSLRTRSLLHGPLRPWKLPGERLSGKLRRGKLRSCAERRGLRLSGERSAAWASGTGRPHPGLPKARLTIPGQGCPALTTVRSAVVPCAWLRAARPPGAALLGAKLPIDRRRAALTSTAGKLARVRARCPGRERPGGWCGLRAAHGRALRPRAGGRHGLPARSVAIGATVIRSGSTGGLSRETWPATESTGSGPGPGRAGTGRARTAAQASVTRTPAKPRTPIPRTLVTR